MFRKIFINGLLAFLMAGCQHEKAEIVPRTPDRENGDKVPVTFSMQMAGLETGTEIVPMGVSTRAADTVYTKISPFYTCILLKKADTRWIVDTVINNKLTSEGYNGIEIKKNNKTIGELRLELRPGTYHMTLYFNLNDSKWNPDLKPGTVVKDDAGTVPVPYACQYSYQTNMSFYGYNYGRRTLYREPFIGTSDFTVEKTSDLHTGSPNMRLTVSLRRKATRFRFLLKDQPSPEKSLTFDMNTEHTIKATLIAVPGQKFPEGIDVWGDAYYLTPPTTELPICVCQNKALPGTNGSSYIFTTHNAHVYSPYLFSDDNVPEGVTCKVDLEIISEQQGDPCYSFDETSGPLPIMTLKPNATGGVVFVVSDPMVPSSTSSGQLNKTVRVAEPEEDPATLFDQYEEWNH